MSHHRTRHEASLGSNLLILLQSTLFLRHILAFQNYDNPGNRSRPPRTECRDPTSPPIITCRRIHRRADSDRDRVIALWSRIHRDPAADTVWRIPRTLSTTTTRTTGPTMTWTSTWPAIPPRGAASCRSKISWAPTSPRRSFLLKRVQ